MGSDKKGASVSAVLFSNIGIMNNKYMCYNFSPGTFNTQVKAGYLNSPYFAKTNYLNYLLPLDLYSVYTANK